MLEEPSPSEMFDALRGGDGEVAAAPAPARPAATIEDTDAKTPARPARSPDLLDRTFDRYFFIGRGGYFLRSRDRFIPIPGEAQAKHHLMRDGWNKQELPFLLCEVRERNFVSYAGPMPGQPLGIYDCADSPGRYLVTCSPTIIQPCPGPYPTIIRIFKGLLEDGDQPDQKPAVLAWLKQARENVVTGTRRPLPALALIGPRGGGKSLFLELARVCLGGRSTSALLGLIRESGFNAELLHGELLTIDDERAGRDHRARTRLAQGIKTTLFAGHIRIEQKGRDPFTCRPVHALAIALNDEAEHVQVLPTFDDSLRDKLSLIRCGRVDFTEAEARDRGALWARIMGEVPGFLHALQSWRTPDHLRDVRTGAAAFQNPAVLRMLAEISPEVRLLELIRLCSGVKAEVQKATTAKGWKATAAKIESELIACEITRHPARSVLSWSGACGTYLGRLADEGGHGITRGGQSGGIQTYFVTIPPEDEAEDTTETEKE